jgi:superfamily II DNA or RNA helicase
MSTPILRPYQEDAITRVRAAFREARRVLLVMPTGAGKTVCFAYVTHGAMRRGNRVLILAHRQELVDQISSALKSFDVDHGFIAAGYYERPRAMVQVGSTASVVRRLQRTVPPDLIVIDEAHHTTRKNTLGQILSAFPKARVLGVTATPVRLSGEGLGEVFERMVIGPTTQELMDLGALCPVRVYAPPGIDTSSLHMRAGDFAVAELIAAADKPKITGDAVDHYTRLARGRLGVAFCVSIDHAQHVAAQFTDAGYVAVRIDGAMDHMERRRIVAAFRERKIDVITSCDLISEGFDLPAIECGISLRPTASAGLWLQQVGRCLRTADGKSDAIILDHAGNTLRHGLPTEPREWTLDGRERRSKRAASDGAVSVRVCSTCFAASPSGVTVCRSCGHPFPLQARKVDRVDGELQEITSARIFTPEQRAARQEQGRATDMRKLIELGTMRGYKDPAAWARHIIDARMAKQSRRAG